MGTIIKMCAFFITLLFLLAFLLQKDRNHRKERIANTITLNRKVELWYLGGFKDTLNIKFPENGTYKFRTSKGSSTLVFETKEGYEHSSIKNVVNIKFLD